MKTRQKALDKFMKRLVDHPVLSFSEHLKTFLTAKAWVSLSLVWGFLQISFLILSFLNELISSSPSGIIRKPGEIEVN